MELLPSEIETLRDMVTQEWFPHGERELEATFGVDGVVDSTRFLAVAQRLKSKGLKEVRQPDRLTISLEDNTRYTIQGEGTIAQYCQDNKIAGKSPVIMIKDRAGNLHTLDVKEYDTRIKIRREIPLDSNDPRVKSHLATWDQRVKFFRLIQRWTFVGKGVIFDLSMVRSTKKDDRGLWKQVTKFYDEDKHHNIMKEMPSYEIEVELNRDSEDADAPDKALACLVQGIGEILRGIQRNPVLIRNSMKTKVLDGYKRLVGEKDEVGFRGFRGVQPVTLEKANFLGIGGARKPSIRTGYNVTEKADGLRVMGYCNDKGELFMIDMGLNVYRTGLKKLACKNTLVDGEWITQNKEGEGVQMFMIFDIYHGLNDEGVWALGFWHPLDAVPSRYKALVAWCTAWRSEGGPIPLVKGLTPQNSLKVMEKKFFFADGEDIFAKCGQMLSRDVPYNTDGLILTSNEEPIPVKFGVRFNKQFKWKPSHDNTIDFLVKIVQDPESNQDKLSDIIRSDTSDTVKYKTLRLFIGTSADPAYDDPRRTVLLVRKLPSGRPGGRGARKYRMRPVLFKPKDVEDSMASVCYLEAKEDLATGEWIVRCSTKDDAPGEATGDPITNNSIVEMRYDPDPSLPAGWNWVPIRVRYDKTERFQSGSIEKTLNSVETAESVWKSIQDPITKHMISTGDANPSEEERASLHIQQQQSTLSNRYYQKKGTIQNVGLVKGMAKFHNLAIKGDILTHSILSNSSLGLPQQKKVLDTSIGKGGDLGRYMTNVQLLVGIDLDAEGIRDPDEGCYRRYLDRLVETPSSATTTPPMLFLIGDSSKRYADGTSGINEEEADMMRATFGKVPPAAKVPPYVESKFKNQLKDGADLMTSMFSIHYYFESKDKWEGFLNNIRENLKIGGFFVCCCFDGNLLADLFGEMEKGESLQGEDSITKARIWTITKQNSLGLTLPETVEDGFGHAIDVDFLSIGSTHREYLVSFGLLLDQMRSIGCELASELDCRALGIPAATELFSETFDRNKAYYEAMYPMSEEVKNFSFFNRWYVFRRYGSAAGVREIGDNVEPATPVFAPRSPDEAPAAGPFVPRSPAYAPTSPAYAPTSPVGPGAAVLANRPASAAWAAVPLSGVPAQDAALRAAPVSVWGAAAASAWGAPVSAWAAPPGYVPAWAPWGATAAAPLPPATPPYRPTSPNAPPATPPYRPTSPNAPPATPPYRPTSPNAPPATPPYRPTSPNAPPNSRPSTPSNSRPSTPGSELATPVVVGGARTVAVERATAAGPQRKFKASEVFRFFGRAELKDTLKINDPGAGRWLALSAPFPIKDKEVEYPTVNHYLAAMKYKIATDKPELAEDLFSSKGTIHTKYLRQRDQIASFHKGQDQKRQVKESEDQELLRAEAADVAEAAQPRMIKRYKAEFDEAKWLAHKDDVLKEALKQRWTRDERFRKIVEAARTQEKYLLYYTGSTTLTSFGGIRRDDGHIEGENQVGKIIMELAGFPNT